MGVSDVCPTVDAIRAFLEHLVDPMLAEKPSIGDDPPLSQQQKVAKQVHSVVLLYNYYHRKQNPELEFVAFREFCKLIVDLRPALLQYMKFTQKPVDLVDVEQQLSLTEKAIMSSYDVCTLLDASKNVSNIEGWPISKVSVLLIDSKKENCFLLYGSITDGVRSLIEKEVDTSNKISEITTSNKISEVTSEFKTYKKRRVIKKPSKDGLNVDEDRILQVGYSAVKEAAGVNSVDIMRLESYTVYSHSKEKTASRFYIMKCSQSVNEGFIQVPIKDLIESIRGPLVKRSSSSWKITPVVEYFHMLPYSEIISEWISRETFSNSWQDSKLAEKQFPKLEVTESDVSSEGMSVGLDNKPCSDTIVAFNQKQFPKLEVTESHTSSEGMSVGLDNKPCSDTIVALNQKENNGCGTNTQCGSVKKDQDMDVDNSSRKITKLEVTESHASSEGMSVGLDNKPHGDTIVALNQKENTGCGTITQCGSVKKDQDMDVDNSSRKMTKLEVTESHASSEGMSVGLDNKPHGDTIVALNQKENTGCGTITPCGSVKKDQDMDVDNSSRKRTKLDITESHVISEGMSIDLDNKPCSDTIAALNQKENNSCDTITQCGFVKKDQDMDVDNSLVLPSKIKEESQKIENPSVQHHSNECTRPSEAEKVVSTRMHITEGGIRDQSAYDKICADAAFENKSIEKCTLIADNFNTDLEKVRTFIASKGKMGRSDVCPTVDAVRAFLEHLVDPLLPAKASIRVDPSISQQQKVAKQVHSVVLLYNYYHIKQHPELEFVEFKDFCKLIVDLRPALSIYMKFMQKPDETDLVDVEQQLSLTEKAIMSSCDICTCLDASKNVPNIEGWPVSKVAVLLVDSKKENCCLCFCSITDGVWSVIEKDADSSNQISEVTNGIKHTYKNRRVIQQPTKNGLNVDDDDVEFLQVGYSAVKEATGVNSIDIMLLESYTVYSQSKEKTASRFYIMKCSQSTAEGSIQVPIKDLIESSRGSLLKRSSSSWTITSVVEYFHVLPYSEIISEWISRETFSNSLQDSKLTEKQFPKHEVTEGMSIDLDNKPGSDTIVALNQKENNGCSTITRCDSVKKDEDMDVDNSSVFPSKNKEECQKHNGNTLQVNEDQKIENPSVQHSNEYTRPSKAEKVGSKRKHISQGGIKDQPAFDKIGAGTTFENDSVEKCTLKANNSNTDVEKLRIFIASKGKMLSQTALNSLIRKRNALALQQRMIEDEMAVCNMKIQRWLAGDEDDLELKLESIIEGCNGSWLRNQGRMCPYFDDQCLPPSVNSKRLTEAVLTLQSACQELDGICHENNWILPTYSLSQSDGGFQANVRVKGVDFEYSCGGDSCSFPREARDSAAARMLTKLRSLAKNQPSNFGSCV